MILIILAILLLLSNTTFAEVLVPHTDLTYLGAFEIPGTDNGTCRNWRYMLGFIAYNQNGDNGNGSLIVAGPVGCPMLGEISIPELVIGTRDQLNEATIIQPYTNVSNGDLPDDLMTNTRIGMGDFVILPDDTGDRIFFTTLKMYNQESQSYWDTWMASVGMDFSTSLDFKGWWQIDGLYIGDAGHYVSRIPDDFADAYLSGNRLLVGNNNYAGGGTWGAGLSAINPYNAGEQPPPANTKLPYITLVNYDDESVMDNFFAVGNPASYRWVDSDGGKRTIIASSMYFGRWRGREEASSTDWTLTETGWYYGERHPEGTGYKGFQAEPYAYSLMLYDPEDIRKAVQGEIHYYDVQPKYFYNMSKYFYNEPYFLGLKSRYAGGLTYDSDGKRLFVVEKADGYQAVVHVFGVGDGGGTPDTTPPTSPSNLRITASDETSISLAWDGSTDDKTGITYLLYLNDYPVVRIPNGQTSYVYGPAGDFVTKWRAGLDVSEGYPAINTFRFRVAAVDDYFNKSGLSNEVVKSYATAAGGHIDFVGSGSLHMGGSGSMIFNNQ